MNYLFSLKTGYKFVRENVKGVSISTIKDFPRMSAAIFNCKGKTWKIKCIGIDRMYFVLAGRGEFIIGKVKIEVFRNNLIIVPKNKWYTYQGNMKCLLVNSPAFEKDKELRKDN